MTLITFLIPSRSRIQKLIDCVRNIEKQVGNDHELVQVIIRLDLDDKESFKILDEKFNIKIKVIIGERGRGYCDLYKYYNECAYISRGKYLLMWNDDSNFRDENWLKIFSEETKRIAEESIIPYSYWFSGTPTTEYFPDGSSRYRDWPCFIALNRIVFEKMGFYSLHQQNDTFLYHILEPIKYLRKIEDINVDHIAAIDIDESNADDVTKEVKQLYSHDFNFKLIKDTQNKIIN